MSEKPVEAAQTEEKAEPKRVRNKYADHLNRKKKKLPKNVKRVISAVILLGVIGGATFLVWKTNQTADNVQDSTTIGYTIRSSLETYVEGSGMTAAKNKVELGKDLKGDVTQVNVKIGDTVHIGDVLFVVDPADTRKELDTATSELDDAMRAVDEAQAGLRTAQKNTNNLTVTAPFSGKMLPIETDGKAVDFKVGQNLSSGTVIGTMVDDSQMRLPLYFNHAYINDIQVGATANISIPVSMSSLTGTVSEIEKVQKVSDDGVVLFRVIITMSNPGTLKKDMVATASVQTANGQVMPADSGILEYTREEEVTLESSGEVVEINNLDNYRYTSGAVLCRLKNEDLQDAIGTAQRTLESAQKTVQTKQERIAELQKLINDSTVTATIDGIVTSLNVTEGEKLESSTTAPCTIADLSNIIVKANIPELDVDKVQNGMPVVITLDNDDAQTPYSGVVDSVSLQAETANSGSGSNSGSSNTFPAVFQLDAGELVPDRSVSYKITTASRMDCIVVPSTAIVYTEEGAAIYAKPAEGQTFENQQPIPEGSDVPEGYVLVPVEVGIADTSNTEILSGLDEGVEVFLAGPVDPYAQNNMGGAVMVG